MGGKKKKKIELHKRKCARMEFLGIVLQLNRAAYYYKILSCCAESFEINCSTFYVLVLKIPNNRKKKAVIPTRQWPLYRLRPVENTIILQSRFKFPSSCTIYCSDSDIILGYYTKVASLPRVKNETFEVIFEANIRTYMHHRRVCTIAHVEIEKVTNN